MARVDADHVKAVLAPGKDYDTENAPSLTRFIQMANLFTTRVNTCATNKGVTLTSDELIEIEGLIAAHCYCMSDQTYASKNTEGAGASFHGQTGMRIEATKYGQMAMMVDPSGCVGAIGKGQRAGAFWLGKAPSGQTDYVDRD